MSSRRNVLSATPFDVVCLTWFLRHKNSLQVVDTWEQHNKADKDTSWHRFLIKLIRNPQSALKVITLEKFSRIRSRSFRFQEGFVATTKVKKIIKISSQTPQARRHGNYFPIMRLRMTFWWWQSSSSSTNDENAKNKGRQRESRKEVYRHYGLVDGKSRHRSFLAGASALGFVPKQSSFECDLGLHCGSLSRSDTIVKTCKFSARNFFLRRRFLVENFIRKNPPRHF